MFGEFSRPMAGHDLAHDFLLHETPRPVACRAFVVRQEFFDRVVIERGGGQPMSTLVWPLFWNKKIDIAERLGSARVSRAGERVLAIANFSVDSHPLLRIKFQGE